MFTFSRHKLPGHSFLASGKAYITWLNPYMCNLMNVITIITGLFKHFLSLASLKAVALTLRALTLSPHQPYSRPIIHPIHRQVAIQCLNSSFLPPPAQDLHGSQNPWGNLSDDVLQEAKDERTNSSSNLPTVLANFYLNGLVLSQS